MKIGKELGDVAEETLRFYKQIGVEEVVMPTRFNTRAGTIPTIRPMVPPAQLGPAGPQGEAWDEVPRYNYVETFHDEGDCDMAACIRAFKAVGYKGVIEPDHTPGISDDTHDTRIGWAFAIGQIVALRNSVDG